MTRLDALRALLAKVEAGETPGLFEMRDMGLSFPEMVVFRNAARMVAECLALIAQEEAKA